MMPTGFHKRAFVNIVSAIKASENSKKITLVPATHEASRQQRSQRNRHHGGPPEAHTLIAAFTGCNDRKLFWTLEQVHAR